MSNVEAFAGLTQKTAGGGVALGKLADQLKAAERLIDLLPSAFTEGDLAAGTVSEYFAPIDEVPLTKNELDTLRRASRIKAAGNAKFTPRDLLRVEDDAEGKASIVPSLYKTIDALSARGLIERDGAIFDPETNRPATAYKITPTGEKAWIFGRLSLAAMAQDSQDAA